MKPIIKEIDVRALGEELKAAAPQLAQHHNPKLACPHVGRSKSSNAVKPSTVRIGDGDQFKKQKTYKFSNNQTITFDYFDNHCTLCGSTKHGKKSSDLKEFQLYPQDIATIMEMVSDIMPWEYQTRVVANAKNEVPALEGYHAHNVTRMIVSNYVGKIVEFWKDPNKIIDLNKEVIVEATVIETPMEAEIIAAEQGVVGNVGVVTGTEAIIARNTPMTIPTANPILQGQGSMLGTGVNTAAKAPTGGAPSKAK